MILIGEHYISLNKIIRAMQNTVVQSVDLQGNRWGTDMSRQNSRGNGISKFAGAAPLMTVQLTDNTAVAQVKDVLK